MLGFLVDNIYLVFGNQVFQQSVTIPMDINWAPLLAAKFYVHVKHKLLETVTG
jgi:hypothetical protein